LITIVGEERVTGLLMGGFFLVLSGLYMLFSFLAGIRTALNQDHPLGWTVMLTMAVAGALLLIGMFLWLLFSWFWFTEYLDVWAALIEYPHPIRLFE
jgi:hypothetical protein